MFTNETKIVYFNEDETLVLGVEDEARYVLAGHAWQLMREDVLDHE